MDRVLICMSVIFLRPNQTKCSNLRGYCLMFFSWKGFDLLCQLLNQNYLIAQSISQSRGTFPVLFPPTPCMAAATIPDMLDVLTDDIGESHW